MQYKTQGVCSQLIDFQVKDGKLTQATLTRTLPAEKSVDLRYQGACKKVTLAQNQPLTVTASDF